MILSAPQNQFHDEIPAYRIPSPPHPNIFARMLGTLVHQSERLSFGLKPGNDTLGVHAWLDDFQGDSSANRLLLFGHEDYAAAAFTDLLQQV